MKCPDIFLDRVEPRGIIVGTNNAEDVPVGTLFTLLVKILHEGALGSGHYPEIWQASISLRLTDAIIFRKSVPVVPRGWSAGLMLEGTGRDVLEAAIRDKKQGEFVHLRVAAAA